MLHINSKRTFDMKTLLDATVVGGVALRNRLVFSSVGNRTEMGHIDERIITHYTTYARHHTGAIITGYTLVDETEREANILSMYADEFIDEYRHLTDAVHREGCSIVMQLVALGSGFNNRDVVDIRLQGASAVPHLKTERIPYEMSLEDIGILQQKFAMAAVRAKEAGFDGVELHAAHGYLLCQFLSPYYNRRDDLYGGCTENRTRMITETYRAVRRAVGDDFPVWMKVQSTEGRADGISPDDCRYLCGQLSLHGLDAVEISGNWTDRSGVRNNTAYFGEIASLVAEETGLHVILTGGNRIFSEMERTLNETEIACFGMARPLLFEPDLIDRYIQSQALKSRCVSCNKCLNQQFSGECPVRLRLMNKNR